MSSIKMSKFLYLLAFPFAVSSAAYAQLSNSYQGCVLQHVSNSKPASLHVLATIKNNCANFFARDITSSTQGKLKVQSVSNRRWSFQNTSNFHVIAICIEISNKSSNVGREYCGTIPQNYILYEISDGTVPPMGVGNIEIDYDGKDDKQFWTYHSYRIKSVRGFD